MTRRPAADAVAPTTLQPGDVVDITIRNARIVDVTGDKVRYQTPARDAPVVHIVHLGPDWPLVTATRVAPAEWPPRAGDVWRDRSGGTWHALQHLPKHGGVRLFATTGSAQAVPWEPARILADHGPMEIAFREPQRKDPDE